MSENAIAMNERYVHVYAPLHHTKAAARWVLAEREQEAKNDDHATGCTYVEESKIGKRPVVASASEGVA